MKTLNSADLRTETKKTLKIIGDNLYTLRMHAGKSLKEVANDVEISPGTISKIEKGEYDLWLNQLFRLSEYYNVRPADLL